MRLLSVLLLMFAAQPVAAVTYDVRALHICASADACDSDDDVLGKFERVNKRWAPMGITFRPTIERIYDATFAAIDKGDDPGVSELLAMAQQTPDRITYFIIQGGNFKCWANLPQNETTGSPTRYALFCYTGITGVAFAHELGHYFCLRHTFSFQDPATDTPVNHNGDSLAGTPDDPGTWESGLVNTDGPDEGSGRDWCDTIDLENSYSDVVFEVTNYPGQPKQRGCSAACVRSYANGTAPIGYAPLTENGMSYYHACYGPWTHDGVRHEYFEPDQSARVQQCIADIPERSILPDACAGSGDSDGDGLCDDEDACPLRPALVGMDTDSDQDGVVDGCDTCPNFPGMGIDTDQDGYCNAIDADDDNDTCKDGQDEHPLLGTVKVGFTVGDHPQCTSSVYAWEGTPGPDGKPICRLTSAHDIDGDGIVNDSDLCPLEPGLGCINNVSCPLPPPQWRLVCALGGCNELELVAVEISNPGIVLARSRFQIANGVLYAQPAHGQTLLETARTLAGSPPPGMVAAGAGIKRTATKAASRRLRFEIRRRDGSVVERIAEVDVASIRLGALVHGKVIALRTDDRGSRVNIDVSWGVGIAPGQGVPDADRDRIFDAADNCSAVANRDQYDGDGDGYGNACDPDLDNDGRVTAADAERLRAAMGGIAELPFLGEDRDGADVFDAPDVFVEFAAEADIDGDGRITADDERLWRAARLGPSGLRR